NGDGIIGATEGSGAARPWSIILDRDALIQTVADLLQLVQVIERGMDVGGNGSPDLNPSRIYYLGGSWGGLYGTDFLAIEPSVRAGVLNVPAASFSSEGRRLSPGNRPSLGTRLASRTPSLLNAPGVTSIGGVSVSAPYFDDNLPLRDGASL